MELHSKKMDFKITEAVHSHIDEVVVNLILKECKSADVPSIFRELLNQQNSSDFNNEVLSFIASNPPVSLNGAGQGQDLFGADNIRLKDYLAKAEGCCSAYLKGHTKDAREIIQGALVNGFQSGLARDEIVKLVRELWDKRWIVGAEEATSFILTAMSLGKKEEISEIASDINRVSDIESRIVQEISLAKKNVNDLDEWFYSTYRLLPSVYALLALSEENGSAEGDDIRERCISLQADIFATLHATCSNFYAGAGNSLLDEYFYSVREKSGSFSEFRDTIDYYIEERCVIPDFWKPLVLKLYKEENPQFAKKMMVFSPIRLQCLLYTAGSPSERADLLF